MEDLLAYLSSFECAMILPTRAFLPALALPDGRGRVFYGQSLTIHHERLLKADQGPQTG